MSLVAASLHLYNDINVYSNCEQEDDVTSNCEQEDDVTTTVVLALQFA